MPSHTFGKAAVLKDFKRFAKANKVDYSPLNPENVEKNVLNLVREHPEVEFYLFWTPYSIVYFDMLHQGGMLENVLRWEKEALAMMLPYKNVHFFSFFDEFGIIINLDNYKDMLHYHEKINSYMLQCMVDGRHRLTMENYESYCQRVWDFYTTYNYDAIYK